MSQWRSVAKAMLLVLLSVSMDTKCATPAPSGGGQAKTTPKPAAPKACDTRAVQDPKKVTVGGRVAIQAKTRSECDKPPNTHVVQLTLWFRTANAREFVLIFTGEPCKGIPTAGASVGCEITYYNCRVGVYQLQATATGNNGQDFTFNLPERPEGKVTKCPDS